VRRLAIQSERVSTETWLNLEQIVTVEMTSEDPDFPIESVFDGNSQLGWRALEKGNQQIRLIFDQPISVKRIRLRFVETELARTQEFTLGWSGVQVIRGRLFGNSGISARLARRVKWKNTGPTSME